MDYDNALAFNKKAIEYLFAGLPVITHVVNIPNVNQSIYINIINDTR